MIIGVVLGNFTGTGDTLTKGEFVGVSIHRRGLVILLRKLAGAEWFQNVSLKWVAP
jgi:hypothetical protein